MIGFTETSLIFTNSIGLLISDVPVNIQFSSEVLIRANEIQPSIDYQSSI